MSNSCPHEELREVDIELIRTNPSQPRRHFSRDEIALLAISIKAVGLIHPPVVQKVAGETGYELIAGERRLRAAKEAGLTHIRVLVRQGDPGLSAQLALIENVQRVDLNPLEIARSLKQLIDQFGLTQREMARRLAKKRSTIANYLRLLSLPSSIKRSLQTGKLSMGHAKAILSLDTAEQQEALHREILQKNLSVRAAEERARNMPKAEQGIAAMTPSDEALHLKELETRIQERLGTKAELRGKGKKGQLTLHYYNLDDLDRILECLGIQEV